MAAAEGVSAGLSAGSQVAGSIMDIFKQADAENLRKLMTEFARSTPTLEGRLPTDPYQEIGYLGDFTPKLYTTPESAAYQTINEDPATRDIQMQALSQLIAQSNGAADAQNKAEQFAVMDQAGQMANARQGAIQQRMERTGQGGTGANALMQAQAAQMAANRAQAGGLDANAKAALQKLAAMQGAVGAAGQVRGQDFNTANANADIINRFNMFNTQARNKAMQDNVNMQNQAGLRNLGTKQELAGRNTGIRNTDIDRRRADAKSILDSQVNRNSMILNAMGGQAQQAQNTGNVANQLGQQGGQLFTNIGSGISASNAAERQNEEDEEPYYR